MNKHLSSGHVVSEGIRYGKDDIDLNTIHVTPEVDGSSLFQGKLRSVSPINKHCIPISSLNLVSNLHLSISTQLICISVVKPCASWVNWSHDSGLPFAENGHHEYRACVHIRLRAAYVCLRRSKDLLYFILTLGKVIIVLPCRSFINLHLYRSGIALKPTFLFFPANLLVKGAKAV